MSSKLGMSMLVVLVGCGSSSDKPTTPAPLDPGQPYVPQVTATALSPEVTNPYFPLPVGAHWTFNAVSDAGTERIEVVVQPGSYMINGAMARIVQDTAYFNDEMIEDTTDWYAQDQDGNVWYLGEDTAEYEMGMVVSTAGSWKWGVDNALPGVVMLGNPEKGAIYRQEYLAGEAEDFAEVESLEETVTVPGGTFMHCLKTHDQSVVETTLDEHKFYCPGLGNVLTDEIDVQEELVTFTGVTP